MSQALFYLAATAACVERIGDFLVLMSKQLLKGRNDWDDAPYLSVASSGSLSQIIPSIAAKFIEQ